MPDTRAPLTPEEFQQVVDRATKTAPPGLSQEEFANYVHQAANRDEAAKAASVRPAAADPTFTPGGVASGFLSSLAKMGTGLVNAAVHPIDTASAMIDAQRAEPGKAVAAFRQGHISEGLGHSAASLLPILGPAAANIGDEIGRTGDIGKGVGDTAALVATTPSIAGPAVEGVGTAARTAGRMARFPAKWMGAAEGFHGNPVAGAAVMAAPAAADLVGRGLQAAGRTYGASAALPGRAAASLRSLLGDVTDLPEGYGLYDAARRSAGGTQGIPADTVRLSREVPGYTMGPEPGQALAPTGPTGWTGRAQYGNPREVPPVVEGELVGPDELPAGRQPAGAIEAPRSLRSNAGTFASRRLPPSSVDVLLGDIDRQLSKYEVDPYAGPEYQRALDAEDAGRGPASLDALFGRERGTLADRVGGSNGGPYDEAEAGRLNDADRNEAYLQELEARNRTLNDLVSRNAAGTGASLTERLRGMGYSPAEITNAINRKAGVRGTPASRGELSRPKP